MKLLFGAQFTREQKHQQNKETAKLCSGAEKQKKTFENDYAKHCLCVPNDL